MSLSVFVVVAFPDQEIVNFLKQYGQLKSENLRRLCYNEEALETSSVAYVAKFTSLDKDLPQKVVTQGLEIFFKYTGQPITCYCCGSTEHVVKNCPNSVLASATYAWRTVFSPTLLTLRPLKPLKILKWKRPSTKPPMILPLLKTLWTILH